MGQWLTLSPHRKKIILVTQGAFLGRVFMLSLCMGSPPTVQGHADKACRLEVIVVMLF